MRTKTKPIRPTAAVLVALLDGRPRTDEELLTLIQRTLPPEKAVRRFLESFHNSPYAQSLPLQEQLRRGYEKARAHTLTQATKNHLAEKLPDGRWTLTAAGRKHAATSPNHRAHVNARFRELIETGDYWLRLADATGNGTEDR